MKVNKYRTTGRAVSKKCKEKMRTHEWLQKTIFQKSTWNSCLGKSLNGRRDPGNLHLLFRKG